MTDTAAAVSVRDMFYELESMRMRSRVRREKDRGQTRRDFSHIEKRNCVEKVSMRRKYPRVLKKLKEIRQEIHFLEKKLYAT